MMKTLRTKLKSNRKGFTLAELLVVVGILAVLVAIAFPIFNASLEKARQATDDANERSAKAVALVAYVDGKVTFTGDTPVVKVFDNESGLLQDSLTVDGKTIAKYGQTSEHKDKYVVVQIAKDGTVKTDWNTTVAMPTT